MFSRATMDLVALDGRDEVDARVMAPGCRQVPSGIKSESNDDNVDNVEDACEGRL